MEDRRKYEFRLGCLHTTSDSYYMLTFYYGHHYMYVHLYKNLRNKNRMMQNILIQIPLAVSIHAYVYSGCSPARTKFSFESIQSCNSILHFNGAKRIQNKPTLSFRRWRKIHNLLGGWSRLHNHFDDGLRGRVK